MPFFDLEASELPNYRSRVTAPDDFDSFWTATLAEARSHSLDAEFAPFDAGLAAFDVFDVSYAGYGGHKVRGWYIAPKGIPAAGGAVVKFIGYNGGRGFPHEHLLWPSTGRPVLVMDTRGQGSGWSRGDTADPVGSDPAQAGFMTRCGVDGFEPADGSTPDQWAHAVRRHRHVYQRAADARPPAFVEREEH